MNILDLIKQGNYIAVNKNLVRAFGVRETYMLAYIADKYAYYKNTNKLNTSGEFFITAEDVLLDIGLSISEQRSTISTLIELNLIACKAKGIPPKRHFSFTPQAANIIEKAICQNQQIDLSKIANSTAVIDNSICQNQQTYTNSNTNSNTNSSKEANASLDSPKKNDKDFSFFDAIAREKGLDLLLDIKCRFDEKALKEKIADHGEGNFWAILKKINTRIEFPPANYKPYSSLPGAFSTYAGDYEANMAKKALDTFWVNKYGFPYNYDAKLTKGEITALKSICGRMKKAMLAKGNPVDNPGDVEKSIFLLFKNLPERWANAKYFSLDSIAVDFSAISELIKTKPTMTDRKEQEKQNLLNVGLSESDVAELLDTYKTQNDRDANTIISRAIRLGQIKMSNEVVATLKQAIKFLRAITI